MSCLRTPSPRSSIDSLDHHLSSGRKHIGVVSWFSVAKSSSSRPVKLQSQPHCNPWRDIRVACGRQPAARTAATVASRSARRHLVAVGENSQLSAARSSPHSGCCAAGGGFDPRSGQRQSRVPVRVVLPSPCGQQRATAPHKDHSRPVTPLPGPVNDICLPLNFHYYSPEVPRLTRQRVCPLSEALVAVSSVKHICIFTAFQRFLQHQGQLTTSFQQWQASPPPTFILRYFFCVGLRIVQCKHFHSQH